jgi:hypothetical protein
MTDQHEKRLHNIELALDRIAAAIEDLVSKIERVTGRDEGRGFLRTLDIGRE